MEQIIIHIFTVGFHHKRGCEIEFMYPDIDDHNLKLKQFEIWKNLPSLALPDGAHKSCSDTINFIIPGIINSINEVLFGISCFQQISAEKIKTKTEDITRNTIQKSVVILSTKPLFGAIGSLLRGITENYFEMGDFEDRTILIESFYQLNEHFKLILEDNEKRYNSITNVINQELPITNLIRQYEHDLLTLLKLILLRKKVLFFMEPVDKLTTTILSLISLFPGSLETKSFQNSLQFTDESPTVSIMTQIENEALSKEINIDESEVCQRSDIIKSNSCDTHSPVDSSLLQNLKSGGSQTLKLFSNLTASGANTVWWGSRSSRSPESDNNRQNQSEEFSVPLPPFVNEDGCVKNNENSNCDISRDNWGFPLDIFDQSNILLPYANIGMLNILDNPEITSFIIGANNRLWKMKYIKYDLIINEDIKNGGMEFCQMQNQNKHDEFSLGKLLQLTVLDRRLADYLLHVVKSHFKTGVPKTELVNSQSYSDLIIEVGEDPTIPKIEENIHKFADTNNLEEWLRNVLLDYIKAILLNAASLGTKTSFDDFGWNFLLSIQQQSFFQQWYYSVDKNSIISESTSNLRKIIPTESYLLLNTPSQSTGDISETETTVKQYSTMNYDHPGRFIQPKMGDNIPGYYQFIEYADHSKALVNKSVSEIKRFSSERGGQLKSSVTAGLSKLSVIAKVRGYNLGTTWWQKDNKTDDKVFPPNEKDVEQ